jgi:hypothetical protein
MFTLVLAESGSVFELVSRLVSFTKGLRYEIAAAAKIIIK